MKPNVLFAAKSLQSCLTLCEPMDGNPPGSPVSRILQARTLEWVAISFSNAWKLKVKVKLFSHVRPSATPWTAAFQAPSSMGFSRQESWSGVPLPSPCKAGKGAKNKTGVDLLHCGVNQTASVWRTNITYSKVGGKGIFIGIHYIYRTKKGKLNFLCTILQQNTASLTFAK